MIFRTSKSKKVTKLGLSVLWKRDNALRVLLTNLELLKSLPRRRRVNFGKKKVLFEKRQAKKIQSPPTQKKVSQFLFWRRKIPNYYWLLVILPNSTLSVFNKKQQQKSTKESTNIQKTTEKHLLLDTVCFFGHYTTIPYLQSPISQVFSTILYYSPEKK